MLEDEKHTEYMVLLVGLSGTLPRPLSHVLVYYLDLGNFAKAQQSVKRMMERKAVQARQTR